MSYDVVVGVSAGSMNVFSLSVFEPTDVANTAEFMWNLWHSIPNYSLYEEWPYRYLQGLFFEKGVLKLTGEKWLRDNFKIHQFKKLLLQPQIISVESIKFGIIILLTPKLKI